MGTYLSTPNTEKTQESGESLNCPVTPVAWGVVDMQGWRKSMEDSHVAQTDIDAPIHHFALEDDADASGHLQQSMRNVDAKLFAVFDGHGGPEVARFCSLYMVSVLVQQSSWREKSQQAPSNSGTTASTNDSDIGCALISTFHALDRMINDPERRDELVRLRAMKPELGERRDALNIPPTDQSLSLSSTACTDVKSTAPAVVGREGDGNQENSRHQETDTSVEVESVSVDSLDSNDHSIVPIQNDNKVVVTVNGTACHDSTDTTNPATDHDSSNVDMVQTSSDDDSDASDEAVGKEQASREDQDMMDDDVSDPVDEKANVPQQLQITSGEESGGDKAALVTTGKVNEGEEGFASAVAAGKVTTVFQKLLNISMTGQSGRVILPLGGSRGVASSDGTIHESVMPKSQDQSSQPFRASLVQNGRMICNLPDHPIHAGATAIVAVIVGRTLTVANAGDSRAVLCRQNGFTLPLSFDHKPLQERELARIQKAGGFVNSFGRVNGNLNLSRSIGDLKYKQVPGILPSEQIIAAEPDIIQVKLEPTDEFIILGCDGIWDCKTNEQAVQYVRSRIDTKTPTEIGIELLDEIISKDPRTTQGIGGDNMTIMIVDLQPHSRSYRMSYQGYPV